jgi:hypothetical protein
MRTLVFSSTVAVFAVALAVGLVADARAQVSDAERAAARDLFAKGDTAQRAGNYAEALDDFSRAQQIFSAPTNLLRIAECDASLGKLVESAETYRTILRTPLPAGAPPAFQAAVDQAKAELPQVEPLVPKVTITVDPKNVQNPQMQIDGVNVSGALIGEPIPLDPGPHKVLVFASGYISSEQTVILAKKDVKTVSFALKPIAGVEYSTQPTGTVIAPPPPATTTQPPPPPPPGVVTEAGPPPPKRSSTGLMLGVHLGYSFVGGQVPAFDQTISNPYGTDAVGNSGLGYGLDVGLRFARQWFVGALLEHASFNKPGNPASLSSPAHTITDASSNTTLLGGVAGLIFTNPDHVSFLGEIGVGQRWYSYTLTSQDMPNNPQSFNFSTAEFLLGAAIWIPATRWLRLLPEANFAFGSFNPPNAMDTSGAQSHIFFMLGMAGYYNVDF